MFPLAEVATLIIFGVGLAISIAASLSASYLLKPKSTSSAPIKFDQTPTTIASRGAIVPYVVGWRRVGCVFAWVGGRRSYYKKKSPTPLLYYEDGWHLLAVGPVKRLIKIYSNGKVIYPPPSGIPLESSTNPSGTRIVLQDGTNSAFTIYWGEVDQPVNTWLADSSRVGVASRWPLVCYITWELQLGGFVRWPILEYEIETEIQDSHLTGSSIQIDASTTLPPETIIGVNPIHAISQLLFGEFPYGLSLNRALFDMDCLELTAQQIDTEKLPCSILAQDGQDVLTTVGSIMQDIGLLLPWNPTNETYVFRLVRQEAASYSVVSDNEKDPLPAIESHMDARPTDQLVFGFSDKDLGFKTTTIAVSDDGQASFQAFLKARKTEIPSAVHFATAAKVAARRSQEDLAVTAKFTVITGRSARLLFPGIPISVAGLSQELLVTEVGFSSETGMVTLTAISNYYGVGSPDVLAESSSGGRTIIFVTQPDLYFTLFEIPAFLTGGGRVVAGGPKIRDDTHSIYSDEWLSTDDVTYVSDGRDFNQQTGGTLNDPIAIDGPEIIAQGPHFDQKGPDLLTTTIDLSSDSAGWRSGRQVALIGNELFFLKKVTPISGDTYRLDGLIRARFDTVREAHSPADPVYIFDMSVLTQLEDSILQPGALVYYKSQPAGTDTVVSLADVTAITTTIHGKGLVPMNPSALRVVQALTPPTFSPSFHTGQDIAMRWAYRAAALPSTAAGMCNAGDAVGSAPVEGLFEITFKTIGGVIKSVRMSPTPNYTYTNAHLVTDFGSEQSFKVEVRNINGGWKSDPATLTVELV